MPSKEREEYPGVKGRTWGYYMGAGDVRYSMSLACLSSLAIARDALAARGALDPDFAKQIEESLIGGLGYVAQHWSQEYLAAPPAGDLRSLAYDLYSFEKMGDLSGIVELNGRDWYREGAEKLLKHRRQKGAWQPYFNTALALLFLNRATLTPAVEALRIGPVFTGQGQRLDDDLVHVDFLEGLVRGGETLNIYATAPTRHNYRCAKAVLDGYPRHRLARLIPELISLYEMGGRARNLARNALKALSGSSAVKPEKLSSIHRRWQVLYRLETQEETPANALENLRKELHAKVPECIAEQALRAVEIQSFKALAFDVLRLFEHPDPGIRGRARHVLWGLTGIQLPFDATASRKVRAGQRVAWQEALESWKNR